MSDKHDAFGNPVEQPGSGGLGQSRPSAEPTTPQPAPAPGPNPVERKRRSPLLLLPLLPLLIGVVLFGAAIAGGIAIVSSVSDSVKDVASSIPVPTIAVPEDPATPTAPEVDYDREPFGAGSMFRGSNLARAIDRIQREAPAGARATSMSVFPGYVVVTFKRRSGAATTVSAWAGGRVVSNDAGTAAGRKTFKLASLPLSPMVRYLRARAQALGQRARGPYAVLIDVTTTTFSNGQVKFSTRPAAGWLIGFEGVPADKRAVRIDLGGKRIS